MASVLTNILTGGALDGISKVIDSIRGKSPEDAAKLQEATLQLQGMRDKYASDFALAEITTNEKLNETAGENIRAESASSKYAAGARPSVIYAGLLVIVINYGMLALFPRRWGYIPLQIPDMVWEIWCVCVTGYVFARSGDKLFAGKGGDAQLPFGIKVNSKGD